MIRPFQVEIFSFCGHDADVKARWKSLAETMKQIANRLWQVWEHWHLDNNTPNKQRRYLDELAAWRESDKTTRGDKPKPPVEPVPKELQNLLYGTISREFPTVNKRTIVLFMNRIVGTMKSRKAAHGSLPGWVSILLCHEAKPSFTEPLPIPFDAQLKSPMSRLIPPTADKPNWTLRLQGVDRDQVTGKTIPVDCELMTKRRKAISIVRQLEQIQAGKALFRGSNLLYRRGKWFVQICIERDEDRPILTLERKAVLMPGRSDPWLLLSDGKLEWRGGTGRHVESVRRKLATERRERQDQYRWASSSQKRHGRERATAAWRKLETRWKEFGKRYNHEVTSKLVSELVSRGIGSLEYWQPAGDKRLSRFLSKAGKSDEIRESTLWDYFQIKTMLAYKCERAGIAFTCRTFGDASGEVALKIRGSLAEQSGQGVMTKNVADVGGSNSRKSGPLAKRNGKVAVTAG